MKEGIEKNKIEPARKMLSKKMPIANIMDITGLSKKIEGGIMCILFFMSYVLVKTNLLLSFSVL